MVSHPTWGVVVTKLALFYVVGLGYTLPTTFPIPCHPTTECEIIMARHMLTTVDNPYNPYTQFDQWYSWDERAGYHTISFLGRIVRTSPDLSPADYDQAVEDAIDEIVRENVQGNYRKVEVPDRAEVELQDVG